MKELSKVDILFLESIFDDIPDGEEHKFSLRYKLRKRQIIRLWERRQNTFVHKRSMTRMKYIIIAIIIACIAALAGFGLFDLFEGFRVTDYDIYSMLYIVDDLSSYPDTIEKKFFIDTDMGEYKKKIIDNGRFLYWEEYKNSISMITVKQTTIDLASSLRLDAENIIIKPTQITINGWNGIYYKSSQGFYHYIFNTEEYIMVYNGNISKSEIENIVKTTKFK